MNKDILKIKIDYQVITEIEIIIIISQNVVFKQFIFCLHKKKSVQYIWRVDFSDMIAARKKIFLRLCLLYVILLCLLLCYIKKLSQIPPF